MANLSALSNITTTATTLSNLILVRPNGNKGYAPQNKQSSTNQQMTPPPALLFHYEGQNIVNLASDITDHFTEDNSTIQDQIALRPVEISTEGYIGELNNVPPAALALIKQLADKLTVIDAYTPALSITAQLAYDNAFQLYQVAANAVNSAVATWSTLNGIGSQDLSETVINGNGIQGGFNASTGAVPNKNSQNRQQLMFQQFYGYWQARTLFTVQTPWALFKDMAIKTLSAVQDAETNVITTFKVTFKQIRFASTLLQTIDPTNLELRAATQAAGEVNNGTYAPIQSVGLGEQFDSSFPGFNTGALV